MLFSLFLATILCEGVNRGMQIRRSVLFFGPIRRSDVIFAQIRIRITNELLLRDLGVQKYSQQLRNSLLRRGLFRRQGGIGRGELKRAGTG